MKPTVVRFLEYLINGLIFLVLYVLYIYFSGLDDDPNVAPVCDEANCKLPNCFCSQFGTKIPGGLAPKQTPQMILLSFDDAVNSNVMVRFCTVIVLDHFYRSCYLQPIYDALFNSNLTNPNGCPIRGTFYLSHQWTDYRLVQKLFKDGHDFGLHSVS